MYCITKDCERIIWQKQFSCKVFFVTRMFSKSYGVGKAVAYPSLIVAIYIYDAVLRQI